MQTRRESATVYRSFNADIRIKDTGNYSLVVKYVPLLLVTDLPDASSL